MQKENLEMVDRALTQICGPDNFELTFPGNTTMQVIVKFDEITTRNGKNEHLTSKDWFVKFVLVERGDNLQLYNGPSFMVTAVLRRHYYAGFAHPHGGGFTNFSDGCFGSGPLSESVPRFASSSYRFTEKALQGFIVDIKAWCEWENDDDRRHLRKAIRLSSSGYKVEISPKEMNLIISQILEVMEYDNIIHEISNTKGYNILFRKNLEEELKLVIDKKFIISLYGALPPISINNCSCSLRFKGKEVIFRELKEEESHDQVNPYVINAALKVLSSKIIKKMFHDKEYRVAMQRFQQQNRPKSLQ